MAKHFNVSYAKRKIFLAGAEMKQQTAKSIQAFQTLKIFFFTEKKECRMTLQFYSIFLGLYQHNVSAN